MSRPLQYVRVITISILFIMLTGFFLAACGAHSTLQRQSEIEQIRSRIGDLRIAVETTREAISRARGAPHQIDLLIQLAELLREEATAIEALDEARGFVEPSDPSAKALTLRRQAIEAYDRVIEHASSDEVVAIALFGMAREYAELGDSENDERGMISVLRRLDDERFADSVYRQAALIALGDHALERRQLDEAEGYFQKIPFDEGSPLQGIHLFKLATVSTAQNDCQNAVPHYESAIEAAQKSAAQGDRRHLLIGSDIDVRQQSLIDVVHCLSLTRPSAEVVTFLKERAYDRFAHIDALEAAKRRYVVLSEYAAIADVARELLELDGARQGRLDDTRLLHDALIESQAFDHIGDDLRLIAEVYTRSQAEGGRSAWERQMLEREFEVRLRDGAGRAHLAALTSQRPEIVIEAIEAYEVYLDVFLRSRLVPMMTAKLAEVLGLDGRWLDAGRRYQQLAAMSDIPQESSATLCKAARAYQKSLASSPPLEHVERLEARAAFRKTANGCFAASDLPTQEAAALKFAIADSYYTEGQRNKANDLMNAIVYEFPGSTTAHRAAFKVITVLRDSSDPEDLLNAGLRYISPSSSLPEKTKVAVRKMLVESYLDYQLPSSLDLESSPVTCAGLKAEATERTKTPESRRNLLARAFWKCMEGGDTSSLWWISQQVLRNHPESIELGSALDAAARSSDARFDLALSRWAGYLRLTDRGFDHRVATLLTIAELRKELADTMGAERAYREALKGVEVLETRRFVSVKLADLLISLGRLDEARATLQPLASGDSFTSVESRLGMIELYSGHEDVAEAHFEKALEGEEQERRDLSAASYGLAEVGLSKLASLSPPTSIDGAQVLLDLIANIEADYLNAVTQGDDELSCAAFARVSSLYESAAPRVGAMEIQLPSPEEAVQLEKAIRSREMQLYSQRDEALAACAERALQLHRFDRGARSCLALVPPPHDPLRMRGRLKAIPRPPVKGAGLLQARVVSNPNDNDAIAELALRYFAAEDFLMARILYSQINGLFSDMELLNQLGLASARVGDVAGALEAFHRAAEGGHDAALYNTAAMARQIGLPGLAKQVLSGPHERPEPSKLLPEALLMLEE